MKWSKNEPINMIEIRSRRNHSYKKGKERVPKGIRAGEKDRKKKENDPGSTLPGVGK